MIMVLVESDGFDADIKALTKGVADVETSVSDTLPPYSCVVLSTTICCSLAARESRTPTLSLSDESTKQLL